MTLLKKHISKKKQKKKTTSLTLIAAIQTLFEPYSLIQNSWTKRQNSVKRSALHLYISCKSKPDEKIFFTF